MAHPKKIEDFAPGQSETLVKTITLQELEAFAKISGDTNALHMDSTFAQVRGFQGRVVHGGLLISYISQMLGMHLPGEGCLWQSLNIKFQAPCYVGDTVEVKAKVDQVSSAVKAIILTVTIDNVKTRSNLAKATAYCLLLREQSESKLP
jgi:acyl dehydratase